MSFLSNEEGSGDTTYARVVQGYFRIPSQKGEDGAEKRVNAMNKPVYELKFNSVKGKLTGVRIRESSNEKYPDTLELRIGDEGSGKIVIISVPVDSKHAKKFYNVCPNIDPSETIKIKTFMFDDKKDPDKKVHGWTFYQVDEDGESTKIEQSIDNEDLPELEVKKVGKKKVYDDSAIMEVLLGVLKKFMKANPELKFQSKKEAEIGKSSGKKKNRKPDPEDDEDDEDDDDEEDDDEEDDDEDEKPKKKKSAKKSSKKPSKKSKKDEDDDDDDDDDDDEVPF